jgi:hypothetical protein
MHTVGRAGTQAPGTFQGRAIRLAWFSVAWMTAETGVAVAAGIIAGSLAPDHLRVGLRYRAALGSPGPAAPGR